MKNEKKLTSKQHTGYEMFINHVFGELIRKSIYDLEVFKNAWKKHDLVEQEVNQLQPAFKSYKKEVNQKEYSIEQLKNKHTALINDIKQRALHEIFLIPKESRNKELLDELVDCHDTTIEDFQSSLTTAEKDLTDFHQKNATLVEKIEDLQRTSIDLAVFAREQDSVNYVLQKYLGFDGRVSRDFLNGSIKVLSTRLIKVKLKPDEQEMFVVNILKLFPLWNARRIIFFVILVDLISRDDYYEVKRDYSIGITKEFIKTVLQGNDLWIERGVVSRDVLASSATNLNTWLIQPLSLDELLSDPLFVAFTEIDSKKFAKNKPLCTVKGGTSSLGQIVEFLSFLEEELNNNPLLNPYY